MAKKSRTYLVTEHGSEDRLVEATGELGVYRHIDPAIKVSNPTKDQLIALLKGGTQIEVSSEVDEVA